MKPAVTMTPDIEELINKVNTLTLDKNRLRQKLALLNHNTGGSTNQSPGLPASQGNNQPLEQNPSDACDTTSSKSSKGSLGNRLIKDFSANTIGGVECSTSCEDDLLFMNNLYKKRIEEYDEKWDHIQSKCSALLSEVNALQKQYAIQKKENLDLEEKLRLQSDENDKIKGELQTVVLNYETQLSAMSEHLSMITSQVSLG